MKVVSHNCFEGAKDTRDSLLESINVLDPDILQLQEINGWGEGYPSPFQLLARQGNYETAVFADSNTRFKLGTLARRAPLSEEVLTQGFWHSAVHVTVPFRNEKLDLWNVPLNPRFEDDRLPEINTILANINLDSYTLITGDFNSLAHYDDYDEPRLLSEFKERGLKKFGDTTLRF
ncbi:MAG: endonuclease/exonuclease/phosphatase family protein [Candidatus Saccharimonas sp.]